MGRKSALVGLAALTVVIAIQQALASEEVCRTGCQGTAQNFKYAVGTTYKYDYEGKIDVSLSSALGQTTSTEIKAQVLLTQQADCNQILRLKNVQILSQGGKKFGTIPDIEKPVRLNFHDGHLEDSICVEPGDNQNSINVKRAIASLFQANLKTGYETDVYGLCPTETSNFNEGNVLVIQKSRNLNKCLYREHLKHDFLSTAFNLNSEIKSSPLLNGDFRSKLRVKSGILETATVTESYLYLPFSVGEKGARADIATKLQLTGTSKENPKVAVSQLRSIIFENPHPINAPGSNVQVILNAVKETVKTIDVVVGESTAKQFISLIKLLRVSKKQDLLAVYNQVKSGVGIGDKETARRIYLDALLRSGNGDNIAVLIELLKSRELNEIEEKLVYLGLSAVNHVTENSLESAVKLLDQPKLPREAYLGIGNLAGRYCKVHSCKNVAAVKQLYTKLISKLGDSKAANRQEENDMIYSLKALANFHYLGDEVVQKLLTIAQDKKAPNRLRVAALEAYLADPCKDKLRDSALNILKDIQQDSEVRINAYLVLAQCPNAKIGNAIKALLEKEPSVQVGGFISSHIRNLKASASVGKELAKKHLGFSISKKFPIDPRKFSFNSEFSYAVDTVGLSATTESNVIFSQNSFMPRSSSLNLTGEIFGHKFNFLELKTRQENLDRLVEHYFGPKSDSLKEKIREAYNDKTISDAVNELKNILGVRSKRDVTRAELDNIGKQSQIKTNELNNDLDLDLSIKAFGSEVFFLNVNEDAQKLRPQQIVRKILDDFKKGVDRLKHFEETLRSNLVFLDAEIDYPTSLGFPLRLALEGSANIQIKAKGQVDVKQLVNSADGGELNINVVPSASVELSGRLTLDALVVENGLRISTTVYTATGGDLKLKWLGRGQGFDVKFGLPIQEQKLISATHEIVFYTREQAGHESHLPLKFTQVKDFSICLDQLSPYIGLTFCAELNGPNLGGNQIPVLPYPLAGDSKLAVTIENDDVSEFHISTKIRDDQKFASLILETISKDGKQKVALEASAEVHPERYVKLALTSPIKSASVEGRIINTEVEKGILIQAKHDQTEYSGKLGVAISGSPARSIYKPILEVKLPGGNQELPIKIDGQIVVEQGGQNIKYIFENVQVISNQQRVLVQGFLGKEGQVLVSDLKVSEGDKAVTLKGRLQANQELIKFNAEVTNNINPLVNFNVKGDFKRKEGQYDSSLQIIHGADLSSKTKMLSITSQVIHKYNGVKDYLISTKQKITYPEKKLEASLEYEQTPKSVDYDLEFALQDVKVGSELEAKVNEKEQGDYNVEFEAYGFENKVELKSKRQVLQGEESKISNSLELNGQKAELNGKIRHLVKPNNLDIGADLTIVLPTHTTPFKVACGLKHNNNEFDINQKITAGNDVIIDAFLKTNKALNANGSIKVNIKNHLVVNGQIKANKGTGNGDILIDLQSTKRQLKADTTFQIHPGTVHNVAINIYPVFNKDKSQKITLSTQNKLTETSIDSKHLIDVFGHKLEANAKGSKTGDDKTGKINGEFELTLPGEQYFLGKLNCDHSEANELKNGQSLASLEWRKNKNTPGRKLGVTSTWKNTNPDKGLFDVDYKIHADDSNGQNLDVDLGVKRTVQGKTHQLTVNSKIHGSSVFRNGLESVFNAQHTELTGQYDLRTTYGPQNVLEVKGKFDATGKSKPYSGDVSVHLKSESEALKTLDATFSGSLHKPQNVNDYLQLQGAAKVFADDNGKVEGAIVDFSTDGSIKVNDKDGEIKGNLQIAKIDPMSLAVGYSKKGGAKDDTQQVNGNINIGYGKGKTLQLDGSLEKLPQHHYKISSALITPFDGYKNVKLSVDTQRKEKQVKSGIQLTVEGKTYNLDTEIALSEVSPVVDLKLKCPDGKLSQVYLKGNKISQKEFGGEVKLLDQAKNFNLEAALDVNVQNVEDFLIKGNVNSPNLNLNKIVFEAQNKPGKTDRKIQVVVKSSGKNLVSGSTNYSARDGEHGKYIVEGSGSFTVKDEKKTGNFKYIYQPLNQQLHGEDGVEVLLDAGLGDKSIDSEFKMSNKQFRFSNSYCEQKKECAHVDIDNKISGTDAKNYNQVLEVNVDLRKLGLSHEFGLKAVTNRKDYELDHTVDMHFQNKENSKYQYSFYLHPQKAGVSLTTPKRIVSLEADIKVPKNVENGGKTVGEIVFYLDKKNDPKKKTSLSYFLDVNVNAKTVVGEVKFNHPGLKKPLLAKIKSEGQTDLVKGGDVSVTGELDVFAEASQKIVVHYKDHLAINDQQNKLDSKTTLSITSQGLGINIQGTETVLVDRESLTYDYDSKLVYQVKNSKYNNALVLKLSRTDIKALLQILNKDVVKATSKLALSKAEQKIDSELSLYDNNPVVSSLYIKNFETLKYSVGPKKTPSDKLEINAGLLPGQIADLRADVMKGNQKTKLFHVSLKLDNANFLKPDYNVNSKEIERVLAESKQHSAKLAKGFEAVGKEWSEIAKKESQQLNELLKKSAPNLQPLKSYYTKEFNEIKQEILSDKSVKELGEAIKKVLTAIFSAAADLTDKISEIVEKVAESLQNSFASVLNVIETELIPQLKEVSSKIIAISTEIFSSVADIYLGILAKLAQVVEKYQPELKEIAATFGELTENVGKFLEDAYANFRETIGQEVQRILNEIKASPVFEDLKAQYDVFIKEGLPNADAIINTVREVFYTIKDTIPQEFPIKNEIIEILDTIEDYVSKKLKHQAVNDFAVFEKLIKAIVDVFRKSFTVESHQKLSAGRLDWGYLSAEYIKNLPKLVTVRFSPLSLLLQEDTSAEVIKFLLSLVGSPRGLFAPFPLFGMVVQGQHIFTFDGQHLTFPGKCNYLLASDAVNGNFSLAGSYKDGQLESITLADKQNILTLVKGGQVKLNNAAVDLPARKPEIAAWRNYEVIFLKSTAGVLVTCTPDLTGCTVAVSGFYHGQVKGLLGNGNNERYDDFTLPNGKIVQSESDFGNAYKLSASCPAVQAPAHTANENPACSKLFNLDSEMRLCYPFVSTENFKTACTHGLAAGVKDTERFVAAAYVAACNNRNVPIEVPEQFVKCTNGDKPYNVGDTFSVKLPAKSADVVLVVDTVKENEKLYTELVTPLVQEIGKELHAKGINDVEFHLITYGGENIYPSHVTNNGKLTFKGKVPALKFAEEPKNTGCLLDEIDELSPVEISKFIEKVKNFFHQIALVTGHTLEARTYSEAYEYPFRAQAVKSIIVVNSKPCEIGTLYPLQKLRALLFKNNLISLNLLTPFDTFSLKDAKKTKDVVGFNDGNVFTLSQGKKNPKGQAELHKDLSYHDYCVDFTLQNRGNVFVNNNFASLKADAKKQFVHIAAHNIVDQLTAKEQGLDCECEMHNPYGAVNVCEQAFFKEKSKSK